MKGEIDAICDWYLGLDLGLIAPLCLCLTQWFTWRRTKRTGKLRRILGTHTRGSADPPPPRAGRLRARVLSSCGGAPNPNPRTNPMPTSNNLQSYRSDTILGASRTTASPTAACAACAASSIWLWSS